MQTAAGKGTGRLEFEFGSPGNLLGPLGLSLHSTHPSSCQNRRGSNQATLPAAELMLPKGASGQGLLTFKRKN